MIGHTQQLTDTNLSISFDFFLSLLLAIKQFKGYRMKNNSDTGLFNFIGSDPSFKTLFGVIRPYQDFTGISDEGKVQ